MDNRLKKISIDRKKSENPNSPKTDWQKKITDGRKKFFIFLIEFYAKRKKNATEFFERTSVHCYRYIVDDSMEMWERWLWKIIHAVSLGVAIWILYTAGSAVLSAPVAMIRSPENLPLSSVPFPAVAICPYNKISLAKATKFAEELIANKSLLYEIDKLVKLIGHLGLTYEMEVSENKNLDKLHSILYPYNLDEIMPSLAPDCEDILTRCLWRSELVKCSQIFFFHKTNHGFCCIFNYHLDKDSFISNITGETGQKKAMSGRELGLSVVVNPQLEDYLYTTIPNAGVNVVIFNPGDYPDISTGNCYGVPVSPKVEVYLTIDAIASTYKKTIDNLPPTTTGCLTREARKKYLNSYSDCIVECRTKNVKTTCDCVPFFMPLLKDHNVCDLTASVCLKRWKENWLTAWSGEELLLDSGQDAGIGKEPPCYFCLPECEDTNYRPHQYVIPIQSNYVNSQPDTEKAVIKREVILKDHSVVHVYFSSSGVVNLVHGLLSNWWDLLSNLGGLCGLVLGASIISIAEIFYFIIGGPASKFNRLRQQEMRQLYWEELRNYKRN